MNAALFSQSLTWPIESVRARLCTRVSLTALLLVGCGKGTATPLGSAVVSPSPQTPTSQTTLPTVGQSPPSGVTPTPTIIIVDDSTTDALLPAASNPCVEVTEVAPPAFAGQAVDYPIPNLVGQVFYSWTTLEQAQELQAGTPLINRTERPGAGPGHAIEFLSNGFYPPTEEEQQLVDLLVSPAFARARYAWPHAWATRMGWPATEEGPAESYGNQLLRITVKPEALWVVFVERRLWVVDGTGARMTIADALGAPERIAGIYFQKDRSASEVGCGGSFGFELRGSAYREFILMNQDMIESWELGTAAIREVVATDIGRLERLFEVARGCSAVTATFQEWAAGVLCSDWQGGATELGEYESALALMNSLYLPRPQQIADIISTLQADLDAWDIVLGGEPAPDAGGVDGETSGAASNTVTSEAVTDSTASGDSVPSGASNASSASDATTSAEADNDTSSR